MSTGPMGHPMSPHATGNSYQSSMGGSTVMGVNADPTGGGMNWAMTSDERQQYDAVFRTWDTSRSGALTGAQVQQIFLPSGLPAPTLAKIWQLCDIHARGRLDMDEFAVAIHLVYRALTGLAVPDQLPPVLVPRSHSQFASMATALKSTVLNTLPAIGPGLGRRLPSGASSSNSLPFQQQVLNDPVFGARGPSGSGLFPSRSRASSMSRAEPGCTSSPVEAERRRVAAAAHVRAQKQALSRLNNEVVEAESTARALAARVAHYRDKEAQPAAAELRRAREDWAILERKLAAARGPIAAVATRPAISQEHVEQHAAAYRRSRDACETMLARMRQRGRLPGASESSTSMTPANRAAALLAERRAALGLPPAGETPTSSASPAAPLSPSSGGGGADPSVVRRYEATLQAITRRMDLTFERLRHLASHPSTASSSSTLPLGMLPYRSAPEDVAHWEAGVGLRSESVQQFIAQHVTTPEVQKAVREMPDYVLRSEPYPRAQRTADAAPASATVSASTAHPAPTKESAMDDGMRKFLQQERALGLQLDTTHDGDGDDVGGAARGESQLLYPLDQAFGAAPAMSSTTNATVPSPSHVSAGSAPLPYGAVAERPLAGNASRANAFLDQLQNMIPVAAAPSRPASTG
ncbi:hypothetical protein CAUPRSCDRAFT_12048 [Caulochytrium protostelioides]|uniref:Actin cytoskeleton-regulatory complex protein PAN1 n=1 Tax=Caulochytrium protostelioides TaxID=1555241 RepID=A0A4P9WSQ4_9FUNG|nr:hypothetical protein CAUPRSCDRAFT_12048 [Caulochytrium protostelioides]